MKIARFVKKNGLMGFMKFNDNKLYKLYKISEE